MLKRKERNIDSTDIETSADNEFTIHQNLKKSAFFQETHSPDRKVFPTRFVIIPNQKNSYYLKIKTNNRSNIETYIINVSKNGIKCDHPKLNDTFNSVNNFIKSIEALPLEILSDPSIESLSLDLQNKRSDFAKIIKILAVHFLSQNNLADKISLATEGVIGYEALRRYLSAINVNKDKKKLESVLTNVTFTSAFIQIATEVSKNNTLSVDSQKDIKNFLNTYSDPKSSNISSNPIISSECNITNDNENTVWQLDIEDISREIKNHPTYTSLASNDVQSFFKKKPDYTYAIVREEDKFFIYLKRRRGARSLVERHLISLTNEGIRLDHFSFKDKIYKSLNEFLENIANTLELTPFNDLEKPIPKQSQSTYSQWHKKQKFNDTDNKENLEDAEKLRGMEY